MTFFTLHIQFEIILYQKFPIKMKLLLEEIPKEMKFKGVVCLHCKMNHDYSLTRKKTTLAAHMIH